jgi:hypothetical protein
MNASGPTGYVEQWANGDGATATKILVGIFVGCRYFSTSQKKSVWNNYWPGSDATGDVEAFVVDDPNSRWKVQAGGAAAITQASIGHRAGSAMPWPTYRTVGGATYVDSMAS